jgi:hypothetical protein
MKLFVGTQSAGKRSVDNFGMAAGIVKRTFHLQAHRPVSLGPGTPHTFKQI